MESDAGSNFAAWLDDLKSGAALEATPFYPDEPDAFDLFKAQVEGTGATGRAADPRTRLRSERNDPEFNGNADRLIAKNASCRRRDGIQKWMRQQLAIGKTVQELVDHAAQHDQMTALLMQEIAAEF